MPYPSFTGSVASVVGVVSSTALTEPTGAGGSATSNEGIDKLTVFSPAGGIYRVSAFIRVSVSSNAATSDVAVAQKAYNDGTNHAASDIQNSGVTAGTIDLKGGAGTVINQSEFIYAAPGTSIVLTVAEVVTGAKTTGKYDIRLVVEQLA